MSLLSRLFLLAAVALLPAIAIQAYSEFCVRYEREVEVHEQALSVAKLAAAEQQQIIQGIRQVLVAMAELPAIKEKDSQACNAYLAAIRQRFPAFISFLVTDLDGRSFCSTYADNLPVSLGRRAYFGSALQTGTFTVGDFATGLASGRKLIPFALPFYSDDGRMGGVIVAALSLDWLAQSIARKGVPPGAALAIVDRNGTYLARYPDNDRFMGRKLPRPGDASPQNTADTVDLDGVHRIVGYAALPKDAGGVVVSFGFNKAQAFAEIQQRTQRGILLIMLSTSLVLVVMWSGARRFVHRPLGQLVDAANRWRLGDYACRLDVGEAKSEVAHVGDAFNIMAEALQDRERELLRAKEQAEEAADRMTAIFESTTDCLFIVDPDWRITYLNAHAKTKLTGQRNVLGTDMLTAFPCVAECDMYERYQTAMSEQKPACFEVFLPDHKAWYAVSAYPSSEGLAIYFRDVTEHKNALKARRLMEEQLHQSQKMEAVGQLTGGIAHDFNNLLAVVIGNLERIADCAGTNDAIRRLADTAQRAADRGAKLTAQLLTFSRRQNLEPKVVDVGQLIRDFQDIIRRAIGKNCNLEMMIDEPLWPCHVDPAQLQTALLNLAINARDAMPGDGLLKIEARNITLDEAPSPEQNPGPYVSLSVIDTGSGMTGDVLERAFEPFFTTKQVGQGTGLGLSMVYGFVRQSGGHVTIKSKVGRGTTVTLHLPRAPQTSEADQKIRQSQPASTDAARILVVDDDEELLEVTSATLSGFGHHVISARSGLEALAVLKTDDPVDLLFSDVVMPNGITGIELAREAKRLRPGIKVLLISGNSAEALARYGASDEFPIVSKPLTRADLARRLASVLGTG
ncbi:MAG: response regulator [Xanthobacteraceae bacterium]|nr:response regulator [Xanthobacteraceae bacterium]